MGNTSSLGKSFFAIAMMAFGIQHFIYADFVTRLVPKLPAWIPWHPFWAYLTGTGLIVAAVAIVLGKKARLAATLLGAMIFLSFALLHLPQVAANPHNGGLWTNAGKALALSGGAFLVASSVTGELGKTLIPLGRFFLGAFLILCGIEHFIYAEFVVGLVPAWIPGRLFWTYFTGVALIAGGAGIIIPKTERLAATLSAIMIFLWVVLLHIPRALADLHNANETTAVFEALAVSGAALLIASLPAHQPVRRTDIGSNREARSAGM
jgi:uncharacterized membrane protein